MSLLQRTVDAIDNTAINLCKKGKRFKLFQFLGCFLTYRRTSHWLKNKELPELKRDMILCMRDAAYLGLQMVGWWLPKSHQQTNIPPPDLQKLSQAAYLEKARCKTEK